MRKRESRAVCLSALITLLVVAPAFAIVPVPYSSFADGVYDFDPWAGAEVGDWTEFGNPTGQWTNANSNTLAYDRSNSGKYGTFVNNTTVGTEEVWTFEIKAAVTSNGSQTGSGDTVPAGLYVGVRNSAAAGSDVTELVLQTDDVMLRTSSGWVSLATASGESCGNTTMQVTRLTRYASGDYNVFRNGESTAKGGYFTPGTWGDQGDFVQFGDLAYGGGGNDGLTAEIEYLAIDLGNAYIPEPATLIVMLSGMAVCLLAKRR